MNTLQCLFIIGGFDFLLLDFDKDWKHMSFPAACALILINLILVGGIVLIEIFK